VTDTYGDFKFNNLEENSGSYRIQIHHPGHKSKSVEVLLEKSLNIGVIFI
jgi:hypothetical protein